MDLFEEYRIADAAKALQSSNLSGKAPIFSLKKFEWDKKGAKAQATKDPHNGRARLIQDVCVSNNIVIIATANGCVLRWNAMDASREPERIEVIPGVGVKTPGVTESGDTIEHVFIDPTANHVIISTKSTDNYYLHSRSQKPKKVSRLQGVLESVAFDRQNCTESATRSFLAGTSTGVIYEMSIDSSGKEKLCQPVYQLEQPLPITSLFFDFIGSAAPTGSSIVPTTGAVSSVLGGGLAGSTFSAAANVLTSGVVAGAGAGGAAGASSGIASTAVSEPRLFVLWSTASPTRLYHLTGGPTLLALFSAYLQSGTTSFTELPNLAVDTGIGAPLSALKRAQLLCYSSKGLSSAGASSRGTSTAQHFALMTEVGVYHGSLLFSNQATGNADGENVILEAKHMMYIDPSPRNYNAGMSPAQSLFPVSIGATEHHFLVLRPGQLQFLSNLSGELVQEEQVRALTDGAGLALVRDPTRSAPWLVTTTSLFQVNATEEDRHVWRLYLDRAVAAGDDALFESALAYSKHQSEKVEIMRARAAASIQQGRLHLAAIYYAQSGMSFDEVALSLLHCLQDTTTLTSAANATPAGDPAVSAGAGAGLQSLVESNLAYFNNSAATGSTATDSPSAYTRVPYSSPSLVDAAVSQGCELTPLKVFLLQVLRALPSSAKMQRTMLCTWLCDLYLHQICLARLFNTSQQQVGGDGAPGAAGESGGEYEAMVKSDELLDEAELTTQFKNFLRSNKAALDIPTTFSLINSRNHQALMLFYAQIVGDYHKVVGMFMAQGRFNDAIVVLTDAPIEKVQQLIYKTAPVLIQHEPEGTVSMLLAKSELSIAGVLPALLSYCAALDAQIKQRMLNVNKTGKNKSPYQSDQSPLDRDFEGNEVNFAVLYLKQTLARQGFNFGSELSSAYGSVEDFMYSTPEAVTFHTIIWMLARYDALEHEREEEELVALLTCMYEARANDGMLGTLDLDYEYILRQCRLYGRRRAAVRALLLLDCPTEAVEEAILLDLGEAKQLVLQLQQLGTSSDVLRALWMEIALAVIDREADMAVPIALIKESEGSLTIDDLLPHLPNFTEIELFQDEICQTLQQCGDNIQYLKNQMRELADSAESTMQELESMKTRAYSMVTEQQRCEYCSDVLLGRAFYLFPCSHGFHCQCLVQRCAQHLTPAQVNAVQGVEELLRGLAGRGKDLSFDRRARAQQEALQAELDGYIAADCPLCGFVMIQSLSLPLITDEDAEEVKAWAI